MRRPLALLLVAALAVGLALTVPRILGGVLTTRTNRPFPHAEGVRLTPTAQGPLTGRTIVVDAGHSGRYERTLGNSLGEAYGTSPRPCQTFGTTTIDGTPEHEFNWRLAQELTPKLRRLGATVVLTRADNTSMGPCNPVRAGIVNRADADLTLSLHGDGVGADKRGFHIIHSPVMKGGQTTTRASQRAAATIAGELAKGTKIPRATYINGGSGTDRRGDLALLNGIDTGAAVLVEVGNMKNRSDWDYLKSEAGRRAVADALVKGSVKVLG